MATPDIDLSAEAARKEAIAYAEHIRRVVESAPPLSPEHAARLRALLPLPAAPGAVVARAS